MVLGLIKVVFFVINTQLPAFLEISGEKVGKDSSKMLLSTSVTAFWVAGKY